MAKKALLTKAALVVALSVLVAGCGAVKVQVQEAPNLVWNDDNPLVIVEQPSFYEATPAETKGTDADAARQTDAHLLAGYENPIIDRLNAEGIQTRTEEQQDVLLKEDGAFTIEELRKKIFTAAEFADMLARVKASGQRLGDYRIVTVVSPYRYTDKYIPPRAVPVTVPCGCYPFGFYGCGDWDYGWGPGWGYDACTTVPMYEPGYTQRFSEVGVTVAIYDMAATRQQLIARGSDGMAFVQPCWAAHSTVVDADRTREQSLERIMKKIAGKIPLKNKPPKK